MKYTKKEEVNEVKEEKFDLKECFVLWLHESKEGKKEYLTGFDFNKNKIVGFFNNKKEEKQPKVRIYSENEEGKADVEIITLWEYTSKKGNLYLSGITNENEKIIAYYGDRLKEARPFIRGYFREE